MRVVRPHVVLVELPLVDERPRGVVQEVLPRLQRDELLLGVVRGLVHREVERDLVAPQVDHRLRGRPPLLPDRRVEVDRHGELAEAARLEARHPLDRRGVKLHRRRQHDALRELQEVRGPRRARLPAGPLRGLRGERVRELRLEDGEEVQQVAGALDGELLDLPPGLHDLGHRGVEADRGVAGDEDRGPGAGIRQEASALGELDDEARDRVPGRVLAEQGEDLVVARDRGEGALERREEALLRRRGLGRREGRRPRRHHLVVVLGRPDDRPAGAADGAGDVDVVLRPGPHPALEVAVAGEGAGRLGLRALLRAACDAALVVEDDPLLDELGVAPPLRGRARHLRPGPVLGDRHRLHDRRDLPPGAIALGVDHAVGLHLEGEERARVAGAIAHRLDGARHVEVGLLGPGVGAVGAQHRHLRDVSARGRLLL